MECDVLISGGGLAGLSAARTLSGSGLSVVVAERMSEHVYRRYHTICGEAISDPMFRRIGMEPRGVVRDVDTIALRFDGGAEIHVPVKGYIVDRNVLLDSMRAECDARFVRGRVGSITRTTAGFNVDISGEMCRCRYLIGADGACSAVRRGVFGTKPEVTGQITNNVVRGDGDGSLRFIVSAKYPGGYRWEFPSKEGYMSVGYPKGTDTVEDPVSTGGRLIPAGRPEHVVNGNCLLVGDAGCLANPLCYGGIGAALLTGRRAAEAVIKGNPKSYDRWVDHDVMFNRHFMKAHRQFCGWTEADIEDAMKPLADGYSIWHGFRAIVRRPSYANVYMCCWVGFRRGW